VFLVFLSPYQTAGFDAAEAAPPARLTADLVRRTDSPQVLRFGGRARTTKMKAGALDIRRLPAPLPVLQTNTSRRIAKIRAALMTPSMRLFMSTSSSTFVFMLSFIS
jgi:hypothetical protein